MLTYLAMVIDLREERLEKTTIRQVPLPPLAAAPDDRKAAKKSR